MVPDNFGGNFEKQYVSIKIYVGKGHKVLIVNIMLHRHTANNFWRPHLLVLPTIWKSLQTEFSSEVFGFICNLVFEKVKETSFFLE